MAGSDGVWFEVGAKVRDALEALRGVETELDRLGAAAATATAKLASFYALAKFSEREDVGKDKRDAAIEMLEGLVRAGRLPGAAAPDQVPDDSDIRSGSNRQVFTRRRLASWWRDPEIRRGGGSRRGDV